MKKLKEMQNSFCQKEVFVGMDKSTDLPVYKKVNVFTTNTRLFICNTNGEVIAQSGVGEAKDFDFDALYRIAMEKSGSKIKIA